MTDEQFLQAVKKQVCEIDPQAEVWLFGSRARGDARPDSDWDF
ncbi:nucleotidyltransferase domain-containing protein [Spirosoma pulveris]